MRIRRMTLRPVLAVGVAMGLATSLSATEGDPGFKWLGLRTGTLFFDAPGNAGPAVPLGAQGGMLFEGGRYGFSFDGFQYKSESSTFPGVKLRHQGVSATLLSGLSHDSASPTWPYLGLGLGTLQVPVVNPLTLTQTTTNTTAAHASFGFLQRPADTFIWGLEARFVFYLPIKALQEIQASFLLGFTWGGGASARSAGLPTPPPVAPPIVTARPSAPRPSVQSPASPSELAHPMANPTPNPAPGPEPSPEPSPAPSPAPIPAAPAPAPPPTEPAPVIPVASPANPAPSASTAAERVKALLRGDIPRALELSRKHIEGLPARRWTIRLEVANWPFTLKNAAGAFQDAKPDLFIAPIQLRGGKTASQLFLGDYPSKDEAEGAAKAVPAYFLNGKQRPIPFLVSDIPARICPMASPVPTPTPTPTPAPKGISVRSTPSCSRCH